MDSEVVLLKHARVHLNSKVAIGQGKHGLRSSPLKACSCASGGSGSSRGWSTLRCHSPFPLILKVVSPYVLEPAHIYERSVLSIV